MIFLNSEIKDYQFKMPINILGNRLSSCNIGVINFEINSNKYYYTFPFYPNFHHISLEEKILFLKNIIQKKSFTENYIHNDGELDFIYHSFRLNFVDKSSINNQIKINYFDDINSPPLDIFSIKLKSNNENISDGTLLKKLISLSKQYENILFRLDGNRKLDRNKLITFLDSLPIEIISKIEYFEEPLSNSNDSINLLKMYNVQYAIDENIIEYSIDDLIKLDCYAIIKPTLIGFNQTLQMIHKLKRVIISSSFDLKYDLKTLHFLADKSNQHSNFDISHGLDTQKFNNEDDQPFEIQSNKIKLR